MGINQNCTSFGMAASKSIQGIIWEINLCFQLAYMLYSGGGILGAFFNHFFPVWFILMNSRKFISQEEFALTGISFHSL